jgi:MFS family permease
VSLAPYRTVLAVPGVRSLLLVGILARVPMTAVPITLTLHVTTAMNRSWAQAGLVTAAYTVGAAVGSPAVGRLIDRRGLRISLALTACVSAVVWALAPMLPYLWLLVAALVGGLFALPVFSAVRLSLAAMVPADRRRPAFALDSMIVELSFMVGPTVAVVLATSLAPGAGLRALGTGLFVSGLLMWLLNPPTRPEGDQIPAAAPSRRTWFGRRLVALLVVAVSATFVLSAAELAVVATLREAELLRWSGLALALWCLYSLVGGLIFGAGRWRVSALGLVAAMAVLTVPIGLASAWPWLLLALLPSGLLCAPSMTAANDDLTRIVPPTSRGEANGVLGSAFTVGIAAGAPFAGVVIDTWGPQWAYAAAGAVGALAVLAAAPAYRGAAGRPDRSRTVVADTVIEDEAHAVMAHDASPVREPASA